MKILLDNCVDLHARALFVGHEVVHVLERGWEGLVNGQLLAAAAQAGFEVLVTVDKNLRYQQNLKRLPLSVLELDVVKNRLGEIQGMKSLIPRGIELTVRYRFVSISTDGSIECLAEREDGG